MSKILEKSGDSFLVELTDEHPIIETKKPKLTIAKTTDKPSKKEQKFRTGDIVELRSGGPRMTVDTHGYGGPTTVKCLWFSADCNVISYTFNENVLQKVSGGPYLNETPIPSPTPLKSTQYYHQYHE